MYKELVKKYIHQLKPKHIKDYAAKQQIFLSDEEVMILYSFLKENYLFLLEDNTTILKLQNILSPDLYQKVSSLYYENKAKYL